MRIFAFFPISSNQSSKMNAKAVSDLPQWWCGSRLWEQSSKLKRDVAWWLQGHSSIFTQFITVGAEGAVLNVARAAFSLIPCGVDEKFQIICHLKSIFHPSCTYRHSRLPPFACLLVISRSWMKRSLLNKQGSERETCWNLFRITLVSSSSDYHHSSFCFSLLTRSMFTHTLITARDSFSFSVGNSIPLHRGE